MLSRIIKEALEYTAKYNVRPFKISTSRKIFDEVDLPAHTNNEDIKSIIYDDADGVESKLQLRCKEDKSLSENTLYFASTHSVAVQLD